MRENSQSKFTVAPKSHCPNLKLGQTAFSVWCTPLSKMAPDKEKRLSLLGHRLSSIFNAPDLETPLLRTALHNKAAASQPEKSVLPAPTRRRKPPPDFEDASNPGNYPGTFPNSPQLHNNQDSPTPNPSQFSSPTSLHRQHSATDPNSSELYLPVLTLYLELPARIQHETSIFEHQPSPSQSSIQSPVRSLGSLLGQELYGENRRENLSDIIQTLELEIDNFQFGENTEKDRNTQKDQDTQIRENRNTELNTENNTTDTRNLGDITRDMADMSWLSRTSEANLSVRLSVRLANHSLQLPVISQPRSLSQRSLSQRSLSHSFESANAYDVYEPSAPYPLDSPVVPSPDSPVPSPGYSPSKSNFYFPDDAAASQTSLADVPVNRPSLSAVSTNLTGVSTTLTENSGGIMSRQSDIFAQLAAPPFHRKSTSLSSIYSSNSNKNVNLATLKRTLDLKPGEGEQSRYVVALRRYMGTAVNDSPPDKWKLPTGILPVDKRASMASSNGRYLRLGVSQGRKKTSGVELKHGHLQPRLLAAEVGDSRPYLGGSSLASTHGSARDSRASIYSSTSVTASGNSAVETSSSSSPVRSSSKEDEARSVRTSLAALIPELIPELVPELVADLVSSSSSGSIDEVRGYYQHPAYTAGSDEESHDPEQYVYEPRLVLVNPDEM